MKKALTFKGRGDPNPTALRTVSENGVAPDSRVRNASQAYEIASKLDENNIKRRQKNDRIYKAYNRFPPTEYSKLAAEKRTGESNVNFGMLGFVVDNSVASFYDMLSERTETAEIKTKKGNLKERREWSEKISLRFSEALESWDDFLLNQEQDLLDMHLYGKGVEMWSGKDGFQSEHCAADEILVPDDTKINLSNFTELVVRWTFTLHDLYKAIKEKDSAESMGWNVEAVIEAMRWQRDEWGKRTNEDWLKDVKEGNITVAGHLKEKIEAYILFIKEYDGKISKHIVLRNYAPLFSLTRGLTKEKENTKIEEAGFLFTRTGMFESYNECFAVFIDNAGSGMWHNTPSLAEKCFVQCRQYDFAMNAIMDAIRINMMLILQGDTAEAEEKLKELVWGPYMILPSGINVSQHRMSLPTQEATNAIQFLMLDMNRGIGNYRIHEKGQGGEAPTATQTKLDASEAAKLTGVQLRRFNKQHTIYYRELYRRFVGLKRGEDGYDIFEQFKEDLEEDGVPKEAWANKNIKSIKSNMLAGAGSPSYKLMAAQQTIQLTNISPKDDGQANAIRDAIAALQGRSNVDRYLPKDQRPDPTWNERIIGFENEAMESPVLNPQNVMVYPSDNHVEHIQGHINDMARTIALVNQSLESGKANKEDMAAAMHKMLNEGGHVNAHLEILGRDTTKKEMVKQFAQDLEGVKREADQLGQQFQKMMKEQADNATGDLENDPEMRKQLALSQIQIDTKQKLANIQLSTKAQNHNLRSEIDKDKAANSIAIERAKAQSSLLDKAKARKTTK